MNGDSTEQFSFDLRTGRTTCIDGGEMSGELWRTCRELNRTRTRAILDASREPQSRESFPDDLWAALVARRARKAEIPLVPLEDFGIFRDETGFVYSDQLERLQSGKEATAWLDKSSQCVYKMFFVNILGESAFLGQKIVFHMDDDFGCWVSFEDAKVTDLLDKLRLIHAIGGCPTEIVGFTEGGYYLVAKQPMCGMYTNFDDDRRASVEAIRAVVPTGTYRQSIWVFWAEDKAWAIGDLHTGNIRRLYSRFPAIIDAHIGEIPLEVIRSVPPIARAVAMARNWAETGKFEVIPSLRQGHDSEL